MAYVCFWLFSVNNLWNCDPGSVRTTSVHLVIALQSRLIANVIKGLATRTHLEKASLYVERERLEAHGADERDSRRQNVQDFIMLVDPEALQFREHVEGAKRLQVEDLHIGQPELKERSQQYC